MRQVHLTVNIPSTQPTTVVKITQFMELRSAPLFLFAYGAPSRVTDHAAVCWNGRLFVIIGSHIVCLGSALDEIIWQRDYNAGSGYDLYLTRNEDSLIVHFELAILRLAWDGAIQWVAGGEDIFTGSLEFDDRLIRVTDFYGSEYSIQLDTGQITQTRRGHRIP
jgi:hypothetical protein